MKERDAFIRVGVAKALTKKERERERIRESGEGEGRESWCAKIEVWL